MTGGFISERFGVPVLAGSDGESSYVHPSSHPATMISVADVSNNFSSTNVEGALSELFTSVSSGKTLIADAITDKGVATSASDSFSTMASCISLLPEFINISPLSDPIFRLGWTSPTIPYDMVSARPIAAYTTISTVTEGAKFERAFNGASNYLQVNSSINSLLSGDLSISVWFKLSSTTGYRRTIWYLDNARLLGCEVSGSLNKMVVGLTNLSAYANVGTTFTVNDGLWHHMVFTKSGSLATLYVDNVNIGSGRVQGSGNVAAFTLSDSVYYFSGILEQWVIWNRALSEAEISFLWNGGNGRV